MADPELFTPGADADPPPAKADKKRRRMVKLFAVSTLLPTLIALVAIPFLVKTDWFARGSNDFWVPVMDFPYDVEGLNADVVIFGDSTALYGVDPLQMERDTGVRAVNLSSNSFSLSMMGDKPVAAYMDHNKTPRFLVVYIAPWNTGMPSLGVWTDGFIVMMRHDTTSHVLGYIVTHPVGVLNADLEIAHFVLERISKHNPVDEAAQIEHRRGFLPYPGAPSPLASSCSLNVEKQSASEKGAWPRYLKQRWQTRQTQVLLYLAPMPGCAGAGEFADMALDPKPINAPEILPPNMFVADRFHMHMRPQYVPDSTRLLEKALQPYIDGKPAPLP